MLRENAFYEFWVGDTTVLNESKVNGVLMVILVFKDPGTRTLENRFSIRVNEIMKNKNYYANEWLISMKICGITENI